MLVRMGRRFIAKGKRFLFESWQSTNDWFLMTIPSVKFVKFVQHPHLGNSGSTPKKKPPTSCASWKMRTSFTFQWLELQIHLQFLAGTPLQKLSWLHKLTFFWSIFLPKITTQHPPGCFSMPCCAILGHQIRTLQVSGSTVGGFQLRRPPTWTQAAFRFQWRWLVGWLVATRNAEEMVVFFLCFLESSFLSFFGCCVLGND